MALAGSFPLRWLLAMPADGESDGCAQCYGISGRPSPWSSPRPCITAVMWGPGGTLPHGDTRRRDQLVEERGRPASRTTPFGDRSGLLQGTRPGVLPDPGPQWRAVTVGYVAAPVPHLAPLALAAEVDEALDALALQFLIQRGLEDKLKEERAMAAEEVALVVVEKMQEGRKKEAKEAWSKLTAGFRVSDAERDLATWCVTSGFAFPSSSSSSRKRKKKRKKKDEAEGLSPLPTSCAPLFFPWDARRASRGLRLFLTTILTFFMAAQCVAIQAVFLYGFFFYVPLVSGSHCLSLPCSRSAWTTGSSGR